MKISFCFFVTFLVLASFPVVAQDNNYDALAKMFSTTAPTGTARFQALGGNHSALGADVSSASGNPAGLGFYTRSEFSFTPTYQSISNSSLYGREGSPTVKSDVNNFNIGNIGVVFGGGEPSYRDGWRGSFGITYSRQNSFYNNIKFSGTGTGYGGSITDSYADDVNKQIDDKDITESSLNNTFNNAPNNFTGSAGMYYWGYVINPTGVTKPPFEGIEGNSKTNQVFDFQSTGRSSQWSISYGGTANEKFYIGGTLGIPSYRYESVWKFSEKFANPIEINGLTESRFVTSSGSGINLTIGTIIKPNDVIRFGFSVATPTWYDVEETSSKTLDVDIDPNKGVDIGNGANTNSLIGKGYQVVKRNNVSYITKIPKLSTITYEDSYQLSTPWKLNGGAAVFFKKKGFISADVEYITYNGIKLSNPSEDLSYDDSWINAVKNVSVFYKNTLNLKVGGEYRMDNISLRGGVNYQQDPTTTIFDKSNTINRSQVIYSAGVGYRTNQFYVDVTGIYATTQQSSTPYRIRNDTEAYASTKIDNSYVRGLVTFGVFF
jgi:hypothetical protein